MATQQLPLTAKLSQNQNRAKSSARGMAAEQNAEGATVLETQDEGREAGYLIYLYNIWDQEHLLQQPPLFPGFFIPACPKGKDYVYTVLPPFVKETYNKLGTTEYFYKNVDGRKAAMSLVNPNAYPGTEWKNQIYNWDSDETAIVGSANNLNLYGVWWSLTRPDETEKLKAEIKIFRDRLNKTMTGLVKLAEMAAAAGDLKSISPIMHDAMDYLGKQAHWHMPTHHMINCPNCGEPVQEGIAFHRNAMGERCVIDIERYAAHIRKQREVEKMVAEEANKTPENEPEQEVETAAEVEQEPVVAGKNAPDDAPRRMPKGRKQR
jgi:endogenous inhibitor of DNA gyrase (YacG/DUF329 family)